MMIRRTLRAKTIILRSVLLTAILASSSRVSAGVGAWRQVGQIHGDQQGDTTDFVVDRTGTLWLMARGSVYRWDGEQWGQVKQGDKPYRSGYYLAGLFGGPDRGAWMTQRGCIDHEGRLYKLESGEIKPAGNFYYDNSGERPGLYVARSGKLFNYSTRFLAVRRSGRWEKTETPLSKKPSEVNVADFGAAGPVVFVSRRHEKAAIWDGKALHANVPVEGAPPNNPRNSMWLSACRWGPDRLLMWRYRRPGLGAARVRNDRLDAVDIPHLRRKIGQDTIIYDGWADPKGNVWLYAFRKGRQSSSLFHIDDQGRVTELGRQTRKLGLASDQLTRHPQSVLLAADGPLWLGLPAGGIAQIRDGKVKVFGWQHGVTVRWINWLFEAPDGTIYAAGAHNKVYRWDPNAHLRDDLTKVWMEIVNTKLTPPLIGPDGSLWVFLPEKPNKISRWDGRKWKHLDIPFDPAKVSRLVVDDRDSIIAQMSSYPAGTYVLGREGTEHFKDPRDAIPACVRRGARHFRSRGFEGPIVDKQGRIWFAYKGGPDHVYACFDGKWEQFGLVDLAHMALSDDGRTPWFATRQGWWTYRTGQILNMSGKPIPGLRFMSPWTGEPLPYFADLPKSLLAQLLPIAQQRGRWLPVRPQEAHQIARGKAWKRPPLVGLSSLQYPHWAIGDREGGFWLRNDNTTPVRLRHGHLIQLDGSGTPLVGRSLLEVGFDPAGHFWACGGLYGEGCHVFLRKDSGPKVQINQLMVIRSRIITAKWQSEAPVAAVEYRLGDSQPWQITTDLSGSLTLYASKPGRHETTLAIRVMDSLGVVGPPVFKKITVDVKLPCIRWSGGKVPKAVNSPAWRVPVEVDWAFDNTSRQIEYCINDGDWQALAKDRRLPVSHLNNRSVRFKFRAIEEGAFTSKEILSATVAVEMNLGE